MKKSDLKTGMLVETREGVIYLLINNVFVNSNTETIMSSSGLNDYGKDLTDRKCDQYDIMKVSSQLIENDLRASHWTKSTLQENLLWERKEQKTAPKPILTFDGVEYSEDTLRSIIKKATS